MHRFSSSIQNKSLEKNWFDPDTIHQSNEKNSAEKRRILLTKENVRRLFRVSEVDLYRSLKSIRKLDSFSESFKAFF